MASTTHTPTELQDSQYQGLLQPKETDTIRISNHNYCGITTSCFHAVLQDMALLAIDIQGISETNLNTNQYKTRQYLINTARKQDKTSHTIWSTSDTESISSFKPGGTGLVTQGPITNQILDKGRDNLGRFTFL